MAMDRTLVLKVIVGVVIVFILLFSEKHSNPLDYKKMAKEEVMSEEFRGLIVGKTTRRNGYKPDNWIIIQNNDKELFYHLHGAYRIKDSLNRVDSDLFKVIQPGDYIIKNPLDTNYLLIRDNDTSVFIVGKSPFDVPS